MQLVYHIEWMHRVGCFASVALNIRAAYVYARDISMQDACLHGRFIFKKNSAHTKISHKIFFIFRLPIMYLLYTGSLHSLRFRKEK